MIKCKSFYNYARITKTLKGVWDSNMKMRSLEVKRSFGLSHIDLGTTFRKLFPVFSVSANPSINYVRKLRDIWRLANFDRLSAFSLVPSSSLAKSLFREKESQQRSLVVGRLKDDSGLGRTPSGTNFGSAEDHEMAGEWGVGRARICVLRKSAVTLQDSVEQAFGSWWSLRKNPQRFFDSGLCDAFWNRKRRYWSTFHFQIWKMWKAVFWKQN